MLEVVLIGVGGALGTLMRYGVGVSMTRWLGDGFPFGTLAANVLGSFLLGAVVEAIGTRELSGVRLKLVLGTGVMGGFTTYSSFNLETLRLAEAGEWPRAGVYLGATVLTCLLAGLAGIALVRSLKPT